MKSVKKAISQAHKWHELRRIAERAAKDATMYRHQKGMLEEMHRRAEAELALLFDGNRNIARVVITYMSEASVDCKKCGRRVPQSQFLDNACSDCRHEEAVIKSNRGGIN